MGKPNLISDNHVGPNVTSNSTSKAGLFAFTISTEIWSAEIKCYFIISLASLCPQTIECICTYYISVCIRSGLILLLRSLHCIYWDHRAVGTGARGSAGISIFPPDFGLNRRKTFSFRKTMNYFLPLQIFRPSFAPGSGRSRQK